MKFKLFALLLGLAMAMSGFSFAGTITPTQPEDAKPAITHEKKPDTSLAGIVDKTKKDAQKIEKTLGDYAKRFYLRLGAAPIKYTTTIPDFNTRPKARRGLLGGIGFRYDDWLDIELQRQYHPEFKVTAENSTLKATSNIYLLNAYFNVIWPAKWKKQTPFIQDIIPYLMAGLAMTEYKNVEYDKNNISGFLPSIYALGTKRELGLNIGGGVKFDVHKHLLIDFCYSYINLGKTLYNYLKKDMLYINGHQLIASFIIHF